MSSRTPRFSLLLAGCFVTPYLCAADADLERGFTQTVRPFLATYCAACHAAATPAAGFDLRPFTTVDAVIQDFGRWTLLMDKLAAGQMPPKGMKQPPAEAREAVVNWVKAVRSAETRKNAGDPGNVLARRLSNAEYNYTIRDLTGVDLQPTREFPVDPANTAGFDNSGESLTMSPALLNKYLQAARDVANHMVLTPDSIDFAAHPMLVETDRDKYAIQRIVDFYERQPSDYGAYFEASWRYKNRAALGKPQATLASTAAEAKLSAKYLPLVWDILESPADEVGPVAKLREMWRALPAPGGDRKELQAKCAEMRDFAIRIRKHTAMEFAAPVVRGLPAASQPLMNWKFRQFNSHRRDSDPAALRDDTDPPPVLPEIPKYAGLHQEAATRAAVLMKRARAGDPDLVVPAAEHARYQAAFERFAQVFPDAFYIRERGRFFPDDSQDKGRLLSAGYHNVMGYWRDDQPLIELILDDKGKQQLDRLWTEFDFIADHTERTWVQYFFNQSGEVDGKGAESGNSRPSDKEISTPEIIFGLRDKYLAKAAADPKADPIAPEAIRVHFQWVNDTLRNNEKLRVEAEPKHLAALERFAARAYRHPLTAAERADLEAFYHSLRDKNALSHEEAIRDSIVRILMSPKFCYRVELTSRGAAPGARAPLSNIALASRLSYFLWSSMPDEALMARAAAGDLERPEVLAAEARRMLRDPRARGLAVEFGGNWLDFRHFEDHNAVDRERFPMFTNELREAMYEEPVRFLSDLIERNGSVLDVIYGRYTFVNGPLAKHYGMPEVKDWTRIDDARQYGRGGMMPMAAFLTQNSPGLRTSPVKRGYWVVRRLLGEVIPPPPPQVPELPNDESKLDLPLRDMLAKHRENAACAGCHARFDSFGLVFENYGPVGEKRSKDLANHAVDTHATLPDGAQVADLEGVEAYIKSRRQNDYLDNISRKLLAYALNRSLMLSDEPVIEDMKKALAADDYRFSAMVETIVASQQFRFRRSADVPKQTVAAAGRQAR